MNDCRFTAGKIKQAGFVVAPSEIHGNGIFTDTALSPGDDLGLALVRRDHARPGEPAFWLTLLGRYLNHADTPNAELYHAGDGLIRCRAIAPIRAGDEVTVDYRDGMQLQYDVWEEKDAYATGGGDAAGAGQSAVIPNRLVDGSGATLAGSENPPAQIDEEKVRQAEMPVDETVFDLSGITKSADLIDERGAFADTYHKRLAIPRSLLDEKDLERLGFKPVMIAVPEAGQTSLRSWRHPRNLYHVHPHGDYFVVHRDEYPSLTMALPQAKDIKEKVDKFGHGLRHVLTEGVPGMWAYVRNRILSALSGVPQDVKFSDPFIERMYQENPASVLKAPPRLLRWLPPFRVDLDFLGEPDAKMAADAWTEEDAVIGTDQGVGISSRRRPRSTLAPSYQPSGADAAQGKSRRPTGAGILERGDVGFAAGPMSAPPVVRGKTKVTGSSTPMTGQRPIFGYG